MAAILLSAPQASGQIEIQYMEGKVSLDGQPIAIRRDKSSGLTNFPYINNGQVLETANGRVWAWWGLFLAENSSLKMVSDHGGLSGASVDDRSGRVTEKCLETAESRCDLDLGNPTGRFGG